MKTELTALLPNSTLGKLLSRQNSPPVEDLTPPKDGRYLYFRITCCIVGLALIFWGLYLAWTKEKK